MRLIELFKCMGEKCLIKIYVPLADGEYKVFGGTKEEMMHIRDAFIWAGTVQRIEAAKENLLEVWTR